MKIFTKFDYKIYLIHLFFIAFVANQTLKEPFLKRDLGKYLNNISFKKIMNIFSLSDETSQKQYNKFFIFDYFFNQNFNNNKFNEDSDAMLDSIKNLKNFYENLERDLSRDDFKNKFSSFSKCKSRSILFENSCSEADLEKIHMLVKFIEIQYGEYCSSFYEEILCNIHCGNKANKNAFLFQEDVYEDKQTLYISMNTCKNFLSKCSKIKIFGEGNFNETKNDFFSYRKKSTGLFRQEVLRKFKIKEEEFVEKIDAHNIIRYQKKFQNDKFNKISDKAENLKIWNSIYSDLCQKEIPFIGQFKNKFNLKISDNQDKNKSGLDLFDLDCKIESIKYNGEAYSFEEISDLDQEENEVNTKGKLIEDNIVDLYRHIDSSIKNKTMSSLIKQNLKNNLIKNKNRIPEGIILNDIFRIIEKNLENLDNNNKIEEVIINDEKKFIGNIFLNSTLIDLDFYIYNLNYEIFLKEFILANNKNYIEIFGEIPLFQIENFNDQIYVKAKKDFISIFEKNFDLLQTRVEKNFNDFRSTNPNYLLKINNSLLENKVKIEKNIKEYYKFITDYIIFIEPLNMGSNTIHNQEIVKRRLILFDHLQQTFYNFFRDLYLKDYNRFALETNDFDPLIVSNIFVFNF